MTSGLKSRSYDDAVSLILEVFRLNAELIAAGDRLVEHLGLTSARWQVLGAVAATEPGQPVAWLARDLGMHRQGVQRITNDLLELGLVEMKPNPHHRRAKLVGLTESGGRTFEETLAIANPWVRNLVAGLPASDLTAALRVAVALRDRLRNARGSSAGVRAAS